MGFKGGSDKLTELEVDGGTLSVDTDNNSVTLAAASVTNNLTVGGDIILDDGGSLKEAGGTAAITFDGSGNVTKLNLAAAAVAVADDHIVILDGGATGAPKAESIQDLLTAIAGSGISVSGNQLVADGGGTADSVAADDISLGNAAVSLATSAGNITIDAQGNNTDIIFKGTDATSDITMLTLDGGEAGAASFNSNVTVGDDLTVTGGDVTVGAAGNTTATTISTVTNTGTNAGKSLTVSAGSTTTNGNDLAGGNLILKSGGGDGTGTSEVQIWTKTNGTDAATQKLTVEATGDVSSLIDGAALKFGADGEVTLTHVHNTGLLLSDDSGIGTTKLMFGDSACFIQQQADGELGIDADSVINIVAPTLTLEGAMTVTATPDSEAASGIIAQFNAPDGDDNEVNRITVNTTSTGADAGISFMDNGTSKWTLGNQGSDDTLHVRSGYGVFSVTDEAVLTSAGKLTLLDGTTSSATQGGAIRLVSNDSNPMDDNHRLGVIEFAGAEDDSNTISVGARIQAICRDTWNGSNNDADLEFYTTDGTTESLVLTLDADKLATFASSVAITTDLDVDGTANLDNTDIDGTLTMDGSSFSLDSTDNSNITMTANAAGVKTLTIAAANSHGSGAGNIDVDADGSIDIDAAGNLTMDATAGSITLGAALADGQTLKLGKNGAVETIIAPHGTAGSEAYSVVNTSGDTDGAYGQGAMLFEATAGGIGIKWADGKDLWAEGGRAVITANEDAAAAIKLHADAGSSQTIQIINDEGTDSGAEAEGAILIEAAAGGIGLHGADDKRIWAEAGEVIVTANNNTGAAIKLHADAGANQTIQIINDAGTTDGSEGAGAIDIEATVGGISLHAADDKDIWVEGGQVVVTANHDAAGAIKLHADAGSSQTILVQNDAGTDAAAVNVAADAGGITLDAANAIVLDSDSGDITFSDGGTAQLAIDMDGTANAQIIQAKVDGDSIVFKQYDGVESARVHDANGYGGFGHKKLVQYVTGTFTKIDTVAQAVGYSGGVLSLSQSASEYNVMLPTATSNDEGKALVGWHMKMVLLNTFHDNMTGGGNINIFRGDASNDFIRGSIGAGVPDAQATGVKIDMNQSRAIFVTGAVRPGDMIDIVCIHADANNTIFAVSGQAYT